MAYTAIDDPEAYFQTVLYTGDDASTQAITLPGDTDMQPDFTWIKQRSGTEGHYLADVIRGSTIVLRTDEDAAENDRGSNGVQSFDSDGFTAGGGDDVNSNGGTFVAWNWLAGGSASSNSDGSITSSVSANTTAGFSIVSYTGTGANATAGHGLGSAPSVIFFKNRTDAADDWVTYHEPLFQNSFLKLNTTDGLASNSAFMNSTSPTSSVFSLGTFNNNNGDGDSQIAYCFAEISGYSKFGSYTGNGDASGPTIWTGFKPAFLMIKKSNASETNWIMKDNKRSGTEALQNFGQMNPNQTENPSANLNYAENKASAFATDILSNGFKLRGTDTGINNSGDTFIYMAFAEAPFVNSEGVPCNAR